MKKVKIKKKDGSSESETGLTGNENGTTKGETLTNAPKTKTKESVKKSVAKELPAKGPAALWAAKSQWIGQIKDFFREVHIELKKVTWPSRKETIAATSMVIILSILVAFFLGLLDVGLAKSVGLILKRS